MSPRHTNRTAQANFLGSARAESDEQMLGVAFVKTADFELLAGGPTHTVVVGRRGAGKSALYLQLKPHLQRTAGNILLALRPEEYSVRGLVSALRAKLKTEDYASVRALTRVVWRSSVLAHVALQLGRSTVQDRDDLHSTAVVEGCAWVRDDVLTSARTIVEQLMADGHPDKLVLEAATLCEIAKLEDSVREDLAALGKRAIILIDGLDEGWRAEEVEIATIGGLCTAAIDFRDRQINTHVVLFLRDNIFRLLAERDDDFSRNIAGDHLRLTWNQDTLLDLVARRLTAARGWPSNDGPIKVWNRFAKRELQGKDGFRRCLKHTLYRPRDVLELFNSADQIAIRGGRHEIVPEDVDAAAREVSNSRLTDLKKEYAAVLPGLESYVAIFSGRPAIDTLQNILQELEAHRMQLPAAAQRSFARLASATNVFQALFGIGFLGIELSGTGFQFCHDGADLAARELEPSTRIAVHPCYQRALDVQVVGSETVDVLLAVNDDYDEEPTNTSVVSQLMASSTTELIKRLPAIPPGLPAAHDFARWVLDALSLLFGGDLSSFEMNANADAPQRRDIVASNIATGGLWKRLHASYNAGQVFFEVKNFEQLGPTEFAQANAYTGGVYGKLAFIVYRSLRDSLDDNERSHVLQAWVSGRLLVLVPAGIIERCLQKAVSGDRIDYARKKFAKWVERHERVYINPKVGLKTPSARPKSRA